MFYLYPNLSTSSTLTYDFRLYCESIAKDFKQHRKVVYKVSFIDVDDNSLQLHMRNSAKNYEWNDLENLNTDVQNTYEHCEQIQRKVSDVLHELADSLPFTGCLVDIYLDIPEEFNSNSDGFLPLYGALRRFKDWHNAEIICLSKGSYSCQPDKYTTTENDLVDLLPGVHICNINDLQISDKVIWRGKISVVDKTVNRGFILPGIELKCIDSERDIIHPRLNDNEDSLVMGRMLEVLDEVSMETIQEYMWTPHIFSLSQKYDHPHTRAFLDHIMSSQSGIIMRLSCYHSDVLDILCGEKYLNTTTWKESIIADITFIQEPEEELLSGYEFIHFIAYYKENSDHITMHQLRSPYELNGRIFELIHHNLVLPPSQNDSNSDLDFLSELPVFSGDSWEEMMTSLKDIQTQLLQEWLDDKSKSGSSTVVKLTDLHTFLYEVQRIYLEQLRDFLPTHGVADHSLKDIQTCSELEKSPSSWSERCLLVYQESQRKSFSRLQSTDSMALSSPVQQDDLPSTIDIAGFLKLFQADGNPVATKLSPVRKRHPSRSFRLQNSEDLQKTAWPDCHYMPHFDIYYNISKKTEKQETQNYKLREKHIKGETFTSGPTTVFKLPKKKSNDSITNKDNVPVSNAALCPRRSPRKSASNKLTPPNKTKSLFSPRKSAGRSLMSPRKPLKKSVLLSPRRNIIKATRMLSPTRRSPRKKVKADLNTSLPSSTTSCGKPSTAADKIRLQEIDKSKRRHSVGDVQNLKKIAAISGRKSLASANDSLNSSAGSGLDDSVSIQKRKESRSERHKRKLEEIVDSVLKQHGVDKDSSIYKACSSKLFKVTKLFVMDLPTSQNLKEEMKNIAEGQVQQVINLESRRQSLGSSQK